MSGLSELLQHLNTEDWSSRRIEKEAAKHGHKLSNATAARYLNGKHPTRPSHETLQAFADLFGTDVARLREAAGLPGGGTPFELGPEFSRLNGPQREAIRTVARLYLEQNDELASHPVDDGATALRERVLTYLEQHLVTDEKWPDFEILPVDGREKVLANYVDLGVDLIGSEVGPEETVLPMLVDHAAEMIRATMMRLADEAHAPAPDPAAAAPAPDRDDLADPTVRDGATNGPTVTNLDRSEAGANAYLLDRGYANEQPAAADFGFPEQEEADRPWEQDEYGLAAKRGRNRGREARVQQDREAEDGGA